jgi:hypothetical protein
MSRSNWKKRTLQAVCAACVCLMVTEIVLARRIDALGPLGIWQLEVLVLPWVFFIGSYLSIVSTSWFDSDVNTNLMRRAASLVGAAAVMGLVTVIYFVLVF